MKDREFKLGGKEVWMKLNDKRVQVLLPPKTGPSEREVRPILEKMARIMKEKGLI